MSAGNGATPNPIGYDELVALTRQHLKADDFDPEALLTAWGIEPEAIVAFGLHVVRSRERHPDNEMDLLALFTMGFQLAMLVSDARGTVEPS